MKPYPWLTRWKSNEVPPTSMFLFRLLIVCICATILSCGTDTHLTPQSLSSPISSVFFLFYRKPQTMWLPVYPRNQLSGNIKPAGECITACSACIMPWLCVSISKYHFICPLWLKWLFLCIHCHEALRICLCLTILSNHSDCILMAPVGFHLC